MQLKDITISVCIPTFNGEKKILNTLDALKNQTFSDFEVLVHIDGSTDGTEEVLKRYALENDQFNLIVSKANNGGRSVARNLLAEKSKGSLLLFFDDDMRPKRDVVEQHLKHHTVVVNSILVGAQIDEYSNSNNDIQNYKAHMSRIWMSGKKQKLDYPFLTAAHFSVPKNVFNYLGGFDQRLTDTEDYDLAIRAFDKGYSIYIDPTIIAWHDDFVTFTSYIKRQREYLLSYQSLVKLNPLLKKYKSKNYISKTGVKLLLLRILASSFIIKSISEGRMWIKIIPKYLRYKIYGLSIVALAKEFPNKAIENI